MPPPLSIRFLLADDTIQGTSTSLDAALMPPDSRLCHCGTFKVPGCRESSCACPDKFTQMLFCAGTGRSPEPPNLHFAAGSGYAAVPWPTCITNTHSADAALSYISIIHSRICVYSTHSARKTFAHAQTATIHICAKLPRLFAIHFHVTFPLSCPCSPGCPIITSLIHHTPRDGGSLNLSMQ